MDKQNWHMHIHKVEYDSAIKGMSYWYSKQHGEISELLCWVKEADANSMHYLMPFT